MCATLATAGAQDTSDWSGIWDSRWRDGGARLELEQEGDRVTGHYQLYDGRIEARADGRRLTGRWIEPERQGRFTFIQSRTGDTFMGHFDSGEWWTGERVEVRDGEDLSVTQSTPVTTMRSFLAAMNESGADELSRLSGGTLDLRGEAAALVDLSGSERGETNRLDYTYRLFSVINELTFRLWSLPSPVEGDEATATLHQAGTDVTFDLTFRRTGGRWFIVGPPLARLDAKLAELAAARGEEVGTVNDPHELRTPRDTFKLLLWGLATFDYEAGNPADQALNTSELNPAIRADETPLLANFLKRVLDRAGYVYWQEIPNDPESRKPYVHFEHPAGNVVVAPVETEEGRIWQFTPETLRNIRALYAAVDETPVAAEIDAGADETMYFRLRSFVGNTTPGLLASLGPLEQWQWVALALAVLLGLGFGFLASAAIFAMVHRGNAQEDAGLDRPLVGLLSWSIRAIAFGLFLLGALYGLGLPSIVAAPVKALAWMAIIFGAVPIAWHFTGRIADSYRGYWAGPGYHETLISLVSGVMRVVLIVVAFLLLAEVLAIPYQGVIAGLGIGGLAVALAAQPTLQNFLSGLTLYADRPVSVGDFCRFGDKLGTIEHIGMRSTRVRSLDRTVITVPNSEFANLQLENYTRRDQNRLITTLELRYETTPDQMRYLLAELRRLLIAHPRVTPDPCRVRFASFGEYSLNIEIFAYIETADYNEFLAIREDIYLRMMVIVKEAGAEFAFPTQIEYQSEDKGPDKEHVKRTEEKVAAWRADGRLPFPDFDDEGKAEVKDTLDYPPKGSVADSGHAEEGLPLEEIGEKGVRS